MPSQETRERIVLVVDDERDVVALAERYLRDEGYRVETATNGPEALEKVEQAAPNLVLLDPMVLGLGGPEICRRLRRHRDVPIIFVTARGDHADKVAGLDLGADDYVTKPFSPRELVARVKAVLRRYEGGRPSRPAIRFADLTVDRDRREFRIGDRPVELRPKEFDLLATLAGSPGVVFGRDRLLQVVWGYEQSIDSRTVDVHVSGLREKLAPSQAQIQTVWGIGYKLIRTDELASRA